jgi:hypothetical protein
MVLPAPARINVKRDSVSGAAFADVAETATLNSIIGIVYIRMGIVPFLLRRDPSHGTRRHPHIYVTGRTYEMAILLIVRSLF